MTLFARFILEVSFIQNAVVQIRTHPPKKTEAEIERLHDAAQRELYEIFAAYTVSG